MKCTYKSTLAILVLTLSSTFSAQSSAYTIACTKFFGVPWISGNWTEAESLVWGYFFLEYEFTYLPTLAYFRSDLSGPVTVGKADFAAAWVLNSPAGTWGLDGEFEMGYVTLNPIQVHTGTHEDCSADVMMP